MHLNSTVVAVRVDGDKKFADYVFDGVQASCWVEAIVAGVGRAPTAQGLCLVYAYPTQAQAIRQAADAYDRTRLTPWLARVMRWWIRR